MYVVLGGNGHVGSALVKTLVRRGEPVTVLTHDAHHAVRWTGMGVQVVVADVSDVQSLRSAFRRGRRAFLLNPPADIRSDTDVVERATVANVLDALEGSELEKVVAESTAGAQPGERIGDFNTLWDLEQGLRRQSIPAAINQAAYYMSNWDGQLAAIRRTGKLQTMYPADFKLPMVATNDLGLFAAERLMSSIDDVGVRLVEGPRRYSSDDVANAFADALKREVEVEVTPRDQWETAYRRLGFSQPAAQSYARMTGLVLDKGFDFGEAPLRGSITLESYVHRLVEESCI
jgi:uncharacterized protein YbjT (DUF2867 family)